MRRLLLLLGPAVLAAPGLCAAPADDLKARPIATGVGEVADLLRLWWKEGTAAGNIGDWYDNRDAGHSELNLAAYPQLQKFVYSDDDVKQRRHWALQLNTRPEVTFGNSSTSAPVELGGSNVRTAYSIRGGLPLLYRQYLHNNLYVYPEHRDHDPGHNGDGDGYGDLYPANSPYVITSQGSSGSDQPFLHALASTLAAFRPEVKRRLVQTGLLMPTLQMILRSTYKHLSKPGDYLTSKAHPSVFEGGWVDAVAMAKLAHAIRLDEIPPMVQLKVVREDRPVPGRDYFDPVPSERLADTPAAIARVFRAKQCVRRLVVSAEGSYDLNGRQLTFKWVLLRGDPKRVKIVPLNAEGSAALVAVAYHERRPVAPGAALESNRVDVGVFAHNGVYPSAPGFITFFSLDNEARAYDERGRVLEVGYGMGSVQLYGTDWAGLLLAALSDGPAGRLLTLTPAERQALREAAPACRELRAALEQARRAHSQAEVDKLPEAKRAAARQADEAAARALRDFLDKPQAGKKPSLHALLEKALINLVRNPTLCRDHSDTFERLYKSADARSRAAVDAAHKRLVGMGVAKAGGTGPVLQLRPVRAGAVPDDLTPYERAMLQGYNAELLARLVYPGLMGGGYRVNYVDPRLSAPKAWRDVYRYDAAGHLLGWTRYDGERATDFAACGLIVRKTDERGRCVEARGVHYTQAPPEQGKPNWAPLRWVAGQEVVTVEYDGDQDWPGHIKSRPRQSQNHE
jgi:hypothetical protein